MAWNIKRMYALGLGCALSALRSNRGGMSKMSPLPPRAIAAMVFGEICARSAAKLTAGKNQAQVRQARADGHEPGKVTVPDVGPLDGVH